MPRQSSALYAALPVLASMLGCAGSGGPVETAPAPVAPPAARSDRAGLSLCGELKVRASADGKSVQVTLDVAKDSFDDSFSRCVTSRLDAVAWRCTLPGSDTTLDLGCDL